MNVVRTPEVSLTTRQIIDRTAVVLLSAYGLTTVHHVYGGLVDSASNRLLVPIIMLFPLLITLGLLYFYRNTRSKTALTVFSIITIVFFVLLSGILHGAYAHVYKDLIFLLNGPSELYIALNPDEHYPPDNVFFEITGILEVVAAFFVARCTYRLVCDSQKSSAVSRHEDAIPEKV